MTSPRAGHAVFPNLHPQAAGTAKPSFTKSVIELCQESGDLSAETVSMLKGAAGTLYVGMARFMWLLSCC